MSRIDRIAPLVCSEIPIIVESGIITAYNIEKVKRFCRGVLIGSAILGSRSIKNSLEYFKEQSLNYPFIWVKPSAFLYKRLDHISAELEKRGFSVIHTFPISNTPNIYCAMYLNKFKKYPKEGILYFSLMAESLKQVEFRGGNPNYSEVWFLRHARYSLLEAYEILNSIKREIRVQEESPVAMVKIDNKAPSPVLLHSMHVPDSSFFAHHRELAILSQFREYNIGIKDYIDKKLYLDDITIEESS